ncbi:MAG: Gfo/Idh/MocA family oxidoreductase [bacterium]
MNIGIIGLGVQGRIRLNMARSINKDHRVIMVSDLVEPKSVDMSGITFTRNYMDIINAKNIDAVFVCTPNFLTSKIVVEALQSGKHVFSEKPPGRNAFEMKQMVDAEKNNSGRKLMFGFNHRHHESMIHAKKIIDSGEIGKVLWMRGRYGKSVGNDFCNTWRAKRETAGGGIFLDQGIHMLDLFLMMVDDFDEVKAYISNLFWKLDVEDNVFAIFRNKQGQVASLHSTMTQWRHMFSMEIFLEKGHIVINGLLTTSGSYGQEEMSVERNNAPGSAVSWQEQERRFYNINTSWEHEVKMFFDAIETNSNIAVGNSHDAYKLMKLVDKVYGEN